MLDKKQLKQEFAKKWENHYKLAFLEKEGFIRKQCKKCKNYFWTLDQSREFCEDSECVGYKFIGRKITPQKLDYIEAWKTFERFFNRKNHTSVKRFPTVARWRNDIYFNLASITGFQPYVVSGEAEPVANPLVINQPCLRFNDIPNVGVTGRHYTNFVMIGQHAFNSKKTGLFYWKDQAIENDFLFLTKALGIPKEKIVFREDVWMGGGNVGPSLEYFVDGIELGNCVFMQYYLTDNGLKELDTKVIDMGAGQERFAWITDTKPMSYDITFGPVAKHFLSKESIKEPAFLEEYVTNAGKIDFSERIGNDEYEIANKIGIEYSNMKKQLLPLQSAYAILDHLKTILFTSVDGMLPSNTGGGYNLRYVLRRAFSLYEKNNFSSDLNTVLEKHINYLKPLYPELGESNIVFNVLDTEYEKYRKSKEQARSVVSAYLIKKKKETNKITEQDLSFLYESYGVVLEQVKEVAEKENMKLEVQEINLDKKLPTVQKEVDPLQVKVKGFDKTEKLYYEYFYMDSFEAKVLGMIEDYVILNKTAFYPEGGGQDCDLGEIDGIKVLEVKNIGNVILHKVSEPKKIKKNSTVTCKIDFPRRLALSQHHTSTHLLNGVCQQVLGKHIWQAGANKKADIAHLDITHFKAITKYELEEIERKVNEYIQQDLIVKKSVLPRQVAEQKYGFRIYQGGAVPGKELRIIEISGLDVEACGGTHLEKTGQIGYFKIVKRESVRDGVERIYFKAGISAVRYGQELQQTVDKASELLKVPKNDVLITIDRTIQELKTQQKALVEVDEKESERIISALELEKGKKVVKEVKIYNVESFLKLGIMAKKRFINKFDLLIIYSKDIEQMNIVVNSSVVKKGAGFIAKEISSKFGGKGGGSLDFAQVSGINVNIKEIEQEISKLV